jgi:hypothetical protein
MICTPTFSKNVSRILIAVAAVQLWLSFFYIAAGREQRSEKTPPISDLTSASRKIDHFIEDKLREKNIQPPPIASDEELLRRDYHCHESTSPFH